MDSYLEKINVKSGHSVISGLEGLKNPKLIKFVDKYRKFNESLKIHVISGRECIEFMILSLSLI